MNLFVAQGQTHKLKEWIYGYRVGGAWWIEWEFGIDMSTLLYLQYTNTYIWNLERC